MKVQSAKPREVGNHYRKRRALIENLHAISIGHDGQDPVDLDLDVVVDSSRYDRSTAKKS